MKKRSLTLLEVIIALTLASILLGTLFTFYRQLFTTRAEMQKSKEHLLQRIFLHERLSQIFGQLTFEKEGEIFYTAQSVGVDGSILHFHFDNGIDPDPIYCGEVKAMLYLDKDRSLKLCLFPKRVEVLIENLTSFEILFFHPQEKRWQREWALNQERLPPMIKLVLGLGKEEEFLFFLPSAYQKIDYKLKK